MTDIVQNATKKPIQPSAKAIPKDCGRGLGNESIYELREFFTMLDKWDREQQEEQSKKTSDDGRNDDHRDSKTT